MQTELLRRVGLSEAEAQVYQTLLTTGLTTTGEIIKKSGLQKSTVYYALENLSKQGLVRISTKNNVKYFESESPEILMEKAKEIAVETEKLIAQLKAVQKPSKEKVKSMIYEGFKAVISSLQHRLAVLQHGDVILVMGARSGNPQSKAAITTLKNNQYARIKKGVKMHIIFNDDLKGTDIAEFYEKLPLTQVKYMKGITPAGIAIYKDFVFTLVWTDPKNPVSILTQSEAIAESYSLFFKQLWKQ